MTQVEPSARNFGIDDAFDVELPLGLSRREIAIAVTTWNRPRYLRRMWASLTASVLYDAVVILVDDASDDPETRRLVRELALPSTPVVRLLRRVRGTPQPHGGLRAAWDLGCELGATTLVNLDADVLVDRRWLERVIALHRRETAAREGCIVTGFNALAHHVVRTASDHHEKRSLGGANVVVSAALYREIVRPCLERLDWDWALVEAARARRLPLLATRPSVVQHVGRSGLWSNWVRGSDRAPDFRFELPFARPIGRLLAIPWRITAAIQRIQFACRAHRGSTK